MVFPLIAFDKRKDTRTVFIQLCHSQSPSQTRSRSAQTPLGLEPITMFDTELVFYVEDYNRTPVLCQWARADFNVAASLRRTRSILGRRHGFGGRTHRCAPRGRTP